MDKDTVKEIGKEVARYLGTRMGYMGVAFKNPEMEDGDSVVSLESLVFEDLGMFGFFKLMVKRFKIVVSIREANDDTDSTKYIYPKFICTGHNGETRTGDLDCVLKYVDKQLLEV